jgi:hypothetical protein
VGLYDGKDLLEKVPENFKSFLTEIHGRFVLMAGLPCFGRIDCPTEPTIVHQAAPWHRPGLPDCIEQRLDGTRPAREFQDDRNKANQP